MLIASPVAASDPWRSSQLLLLSLRSMLMLLWLLKELLLLALGLSTLSTLPLLELLDWQCPNKGLVSNSICMVFPLMLLRGVQGVWHVCLLR
jgi:hypothetical protein